MTHKEAQHKPVSYYLEDNNRLSEISVTTIKKWMDETPFDQTIKLLYAKKLKSENRLSDNMLQLVSTYATDRGNLYDHLHPSADEVKKPKASKSVESKVAKKKDSKPHNTNSELKTESTEKIKEKASILVPEPPSDPLNTESIIRYADSKIVKNKKKKQKKKRVQKEKKKEISKVKDKENRKEKKSKKNKSKTAQKVKMIPQKKKQQVDDKSYTKSKKKKKKGNKKKVSYVYVRSEGNMGNQFELNDYTGISRYSNWLLSMKEEDKKDKNKAKRKSKKKKLKKKRHSVKINEMVISESLADLLLKQGHKKKARRMYKKLSLIFPEKSSYFAAKIETLKK